MNNDADPIQEQIGQLQGELTQAQTSAEVAMARVHDREQQLTERDRALEEESAVMLRYEPIANHTGPFA